MRLVVLLSFVVLGLQGPKSVHAESDSKAVAVVNQSLDAMGGVEAWEATQYVSWRFMDRRQHYWDRYTGRVRIETDELVILMNVQTNEGEAFRDGEALAGEEREEALRRGFGMWTNDSYWVFMPYKLLDPGVVLTYQGEGTTEAGQAADVIEMTFESVGLTPQNVYRLWFDRETHLVAQWSYAKSAEEELRLLGEWSDWRQVGQILLSGSRGRDLDWRLAVYPSLPDVVFSDPGPVNLE